MSETETVREMFAAYLAQDRPAAERLLDQDFVFTSPQDNHIFVLYEYELTTGARYRNVEVITVRGARIAETQVFFGGSAGSGTDQPAVAT